MTLKIAAIPRQLGVVRYETINSGSSPLSCQCRAVLGASRSRRVARNPLFDVFVQSKKQHTRCARDGSIILMDALILLCFKITTPCNLPDSVTSACEIVYGQGS
jgi:hypothetical protein